MEKQAHRTQINSRVRIKDSVTGAYSMARVYMEATVKAQRHDELGYPFVFIEWDKNHWAYSGEHDGWTLEAHFDLIEDSVSDDNNQDELLAALGELVKRFQDKPEETKVDDPSQVSEDEKSEDDFFGRLEKAFNDALEGEAYVVLVARKEELAGREVVVPHFYASSHRPDAMLLLEATMSDVGAQTHTQLAFESIRKSQQEDEDEPRTS